jgi:hypothetical protein
MDQPATDPALLRRSARPPTLDAAGGSAVDGVTTDMGPMIAPRRPIRYDPVHKSSGPEVDLR